MSDSNNRPNADVTLRGDDKAMPMRGSGTGFNGDTYGADTSPAATNRKGGMGSATKSDAPDECQYEEPGIKTDGAGDSY